MSYAKTHEQLSEVINVSRGRVTHVLKAPGAPKRTEEGYNIEEFVDWYNKTGKHWSAEDKEFSLKSQSKSLAELKEEAQRLKNEQLQMKNDELRGLLIEKEIVEKVLGKFMSTLRSRLLSVKAQAPVLAMTTDVVECERILVEAMQSALEAVSELPYEPR